MNRIAILPKELQRYIDELVRMCHIDAALANIATDVGSKQAVNVQMLLSRAAADGNDKTIGCLLGACNHFDRRALCGITPLYVAAHNGHETVVTMLLDAGADKNCVSINGETPLYGAVKAGNAEVAKRLLLAIVIKNKQKAEV